MTSENPYEAPREQVAAQKPMQRRLGVTAVLFAIAILFGSCLAYLIGVCIWALSSEVREVNMATLGPPIVISTILTALPLWAGYRHIRSRQRTTSRP